MEYKDNNYLTGFSLYMKSNIGITIKLLYKKIDILSDTPRIARYCIFIITQTQQIKAQKYNI